MSDRGDQQLQVHGSVARGFEQVRQAFQELFTDFAELGASVSLMVGGERVVDLWAGSRNKDGTEPWLPTTRCNIFSASKAIVAVAVLQLVQQGRLQLDRPVADVWPEFAQAGKERITLRQVLTHRSGMNAFHNKVPDELIYDWDGVTGQIATELPWWTPGSEQGYSPLLFGWLLGELVCRASGCASFNDYVQQHIAGPLGLSVTFGLADEELSSVADLSPLPQSAKQPLSAVTQRMLAEPQGVVAKAFTNPMSLMVGTNQPPWRQAQIPAANGQASACDLADVFGSLANLSDERLLQADRRDWCWQEQSRAQDRILQCPLSFSLGFMRLLPVGVDAERVFCHPGAGGSLGYGDASEGFGFGFVSRAMGRSITMDPRAEHLLKAVYGAVRKVG